MPAETVHLTRQALYELVWAEPMRTLAARYDISDVGLAKTCRRMGIPVPGRGHWRQQETGHPTTRARLPALPAGAGPDLRGVTLTLRASRVTTGVPTVGTDGVTPPATPAARQAAYEAEPRHRIAVAATLEAAAPLHPLVRQTQAALAGVPADDRGLLRPFVREGFVPVRLIGDPARYDAEVRRWERARPSRPTAALEVLVTTAGVDRALRILDALLKALEERGFPVHSALRTGPAGRPSGYIAARWGDESGLAGRPPMPSVMTRVEVGDQDVFLLLREVVSKVPRPPAPATPAAGQRGRALVAPYALPPDLPAYEHVGSGRFVLTIPHTPGNYPAHWVWEEGRRRSGPLEEALNDVVVAVVAAADDFRRWREEAEARRREAEDRSRREWEEQRRRAAEAARAQQLEAEAAAWARAAHIRGYVAAVRAAAESSPSAPLVEWLAWAEAYVDRLDPLPNRLRP